MTIQQINNAGYIGYSVVDPKGNVVAVFDSYVLAVRCTACYPYFL